MRYCAHLFLFFMLADCITYDKKNNEEELIKSFGLFKFESIQLKKPILFSIASSLNPNRKSYILGSAHISEYHIGFPKNEIILNSLSKSDRLIIEADFGASRIVKNQMFLKSQRQKQNLKKYLTESELNLLKKQTGLSTQGIFSKTAYELYLLVSGTKLVEGLTFDEYLIVTAIGLQKPVYYLEKAEEQNKSVHAAFDIETLKEVLADLPSSKQKNLKEINLAISSVYTGDLEKARQYESLFSPKVATNLLYERNKVWMPKIEKLIHLGGNFIVVGVAHLVGKAGLLKQLRENGYEVDRLL